MAKCGHLHATQFADPTPEGVAQRLPAKALEPLGTLKCLDCGDLFVANPYISPVNAARASLAQKVLETVEAAYGQEFIAIDYERVSSALRELFQREGIEVNSTST